MPCNRGAFYSGGVMVMGSSYSFNRDQRGLTGYLDLFAQQHPLLLGDGLPHLPTGHVGHQALGELLARCRYCRVNNTFSGGKTSEFIHLC